MINGKNNKQYFYNNNFNNKNMNIKKNSPVLSHQENNYYYNTKINHLIFQDYFHNNPYRRKSERPNLPFNSMYLNHELLESNFNEGSKLIKRNLDNSYFNDTNSLKKLDKLQNIKIGLNENEINMNSKNNYDLYSDISTTRNKNTTNSYTNNFYKGNKTTKNYKISNSTKNIKSKLSPFQGYNKLKKKNTLNIGKINNEINEEDMKQLSIRSLKNDLSHNNIQKNQTLIDSMSYNNINNVLS